MALSNEEIETLWVDAWEEVYRLAGKRRDVPCLLPDGAIVDVERCLGFVQDAVYAGLAVTVCRVWLSGREGVEVRTAPRGE